MLLPIFVSQIIVATLAISFHKYPYVFLLDVGNEEIPKLNTEQIRLSLPGGSLALKYPATGEGDTIGHIRVSGIDFGTDLKASIVQGGPGYKFVVLVFIGNPGNAYDAVVTIQTMPNVDNSNNMDVNTNEYLENDPNDSAEDTNDGIETKKMYSENSDVVLTQSSSNVYKYTSNDSSDINNDDDIDDSNKTQDFQDSENIDEEDEKQVITNYNDKSNQNIYLKGDISENTADNSRIENIQTYQHGKYEAFRPLFIGGVKFYPQAAIYTQEYSKSDNDQENLVSEENVAQVSDLRSNKYKDGNNNFDPDFGSPVEY